MRYLALRPTLSEYVLDMPRGAQVIYPNVAGFGSQKLAAIRAAAIGGGHKESAIRADTRLDISQGCAACNAARSANGISCSAVVARHPPETLGHLQTGAKCVTGPIDHFPGTLHQLEVLNILGNVIQTVDQVPWIEQRGNGGLSETGRRPQPFLASRFHHHAIRRAPNCDREGRMAAGSSARARADLDREVVRLAQHLCAQIAAVEFRH